MEKELTKEQLKEQLQELAWFRVLDIKDLPEAKRKESYHSFWQRMNKSPFEDSTKLDYLIYKHELDLYPSPTQLTMR